MLIIRGVNVFPSQIESALLEMGGTTPHYLLIVDRVNNLDTLEVQVEVEERFFSDEIRELENLTGKIAYMIQQAIGLAVKVKLVEPKSIERSMDLLITAFENQLDKLFASDALDVSTDIAALEGMLNLDGLTGGDFAPRS